MSRRGLRGLNLGSRSTAVTATSAISPWRQLLRDCRITRFYEGTNGIQAMDLLGRKLGQSQGTAMMDLLAEIQATLAAAKAVPSHSALRREGGAC